MRRAGSLLLTAMLLAGCIPQVDPPRGYGEAPPEQDYRRPPPRDGAPPPEQDEPRDVPQPDRYEPQRLDEGVTAVPAPPPAWKARPVTPDAQNVVTSDYVVRPGDTLRAIGERTGVGAEAIARANRLDRPYDVRAGQALIIPGGRYHLVRSGESGIAIARAYGVDWSRVVTANALAEPYTLRVGERLLIPGSGNPSLAERAAAFKLDIDDLVTGSAPASEAPPAPPSQTATARIAPLTAVAEPRRLTGGFEWPARGRILARFGPSGESGERFNGINIAVPTGTPVAAAANGVVIYAGSEVANLGGVVIVRHGDGWTTVYGNASRLLVQRGQQVKRGQALALSGQTGNATRPQLHFELRKGRNPVDPLPQLPE